MFLNHLSIKNFRCFSDRNFNFKSQITLIVGDNGVGKTSLIEAIHYLCFQKSFRTHLMSDLIYENENSFFLKALFLKNNEDAHVLQIGYGQKKKLIKFDHKIINSYKEIFDQFRVVTLTEDDIDLIRGSPSGRRSFIDQAVVFSEPEATVDYGKLKQIVLHRNAIFCNKYQALDSLELDIWTEKLWDISQKIQVYRQNSLIFIEQKVNELLQNYFNDIYKIGLKYEKKGICEKASKEEALKSLKLIRNQELIMKRSLFGAHLDDISFQIESKKARIHASRGQQKLIALLCKMSLMSNEGLYGRYPLLLIDDFISDFDKTRLDQIISLFLSCKNQIIISVPFFDKELEALIQRANPDLLYIK